MRELPERADEKELEVLEERWPRSLDVVSDELPDPGHHEDRGGDPHEVRSVGDTESEGARVETGEGHGDAEGEPPGEPPVVGEGEEGEDARRVQPGIADGDREEGAEDREHDRGNAGEVQLPIDR